MLNERAMSEARTRLDTLAKPIGSLGLMEDMIAQLAGIQGTVDVTVKPCALVFCADNGVVSEGVSQSGPEVTALVALKMCEGVGNINALARAVGADVYTVDMGMVGEVDHPALIKRKIARGTGNIARGPAMTRDEAQRAIQSGIDLVSDMARKGYNVIATGEMGIANTTTSSAVASVLLGIAPEKVTGRGAGLSGEGLKRKVAAIERAIAVNGPDAGDPVDVLAKVGGYDIAAMCGAFIGGAEHGVAVVVDGLISGVAALLAMRMRPEARDHMLASHMGKEAACGAVMDALELKPVIRGELALGEGSGAVMMLPLLNMALDIYGQETYMGALGLAPYEKIDQ